MDYVIRTCTYLLLYVSNKGIYLRQLVFELNLGPRQVVEARYRQCGSIHDLDEGMQHGQEAIYLCPEDILSVVST